MATERLLRSYQRNGILQMQSLHVNARRHLKLHCGKTRLGETLLGITRKTERLQWKAEPAGVHLVVAVDVLVGPDGINPRRDIFEGVCGVPQLRLHLRAGPCARPLTRHTGSS